MRLRRFRSWRFRLIALMLAFAVLPAAVVGVLAFDTFEDSTRSAALRSLDGIARAKAEGIDQFIETRRKDVERMAGVLAPYVASLEEARAKTAPEPTRSSPPDGQAPQPLEDGDKKPRRRLSTRPGRLSKPDEPPPAKKHAPAVEAAHRRLRDVLALLLGDQVTFEELLVIRADGLVEVATFTEHEGRTATDVEYFQRGRGATYVQPPFVSPITKALTMVIATPIRTGGGRDVGVFVARLNLTFFFQILRDYTGLGHSGETIVGKRIGGKLLFMAPTRHDSDAALREVGGGLHLQRASGGETGGGAIADYRNEEVFAAWRPVSSLGWGLLTKIDRSEALAELHKTRLSLLAITALVILLAIAVSLLAAAALIRPLRQLRAAADRISKGDLAVELDIDTPDEIGELADSFERMVAAIKFFREQSRGGVIDEDARLWPDHNDEESATDESPPSEESL